MLYEKEVNAEIEKKGNPDKIYIGDPEFKTEAQKLTEGEVIVNSLRYKGKVVLRHGHKTTEIKGKKEKPREAGSEK